MENEDTETWVTYNNLEDTYLYRKILVSYYQMLNIVTTVGSGDVFGLNDNERIVLLIMINVGDAIFAVAFGLIAAIILQKSKNKVHNEFFKKKHEITDLLKQNKDESNLKDKVEQYFAHSWYIYQSTDMITIKYLSEELPYRLNREVVYYLTKDFLDPIFKHFGSENLIKDISSALKQTIYLPGDFIIIKDDIGEEMYFIAEGSVYILAADKRTVLNTLGKGSYFGEMAIFLDSNKRTAFVQAETCCSIFVLKKSDLDNIKLNYPKVAQDIKKVAELRAIESKQIQKANKEEIWDELDDPEKEKEKLQKIYSTPRDKKKKFFIKDIDLDSRRGSLDYMNTPSIRESLKRNSCFLGTGINNNYFIGGKKEEEVKSKRLSIMVPVDQNVSLNFKSLVKRHFDEASHDSKQQEEFVKYRSENEESKGNFK